MKVSKKKVAALSPVGQQLMNSKSEFELAFDQIKNIIFKVMSFKLWSEDSGFLTYKKLVLSTMKNKDAEDKAKYIKGHCEPYLRMYIAYKDSILEEDLGFLTNKDQMVNLTAGKSGQAVLPLSAIYIHLQKTDEAAMEDLEGKLFTIFKHLAKEGGEDRKRLEKICSQYEMDEDQSAAKTIGGLVETVKGSMGNLDLNGKEPTFAELAPMVQQIMSNGSLQANMGKLATDLMTGKLDIPTLVGQVRNAATEEKKVDEENEEDSEDE